MQSNDVSLQNLRHSVAHLLAAAVLKLYPAAKPTIGPAIENGFYYDFDFPTPISREDLPQIEQWMRKLLPTWKNFERHEVTPDAARKEFAGNLYKQELIDELEKAGEKITIYQSGNFRDLCRGGHVETAAEITPAAFMLTKLAGAYWRGDEKNPQLQRIYGVAFRSKEELERSLERLAEAERRDHRKLGQELGLFRFEPIAPGAPFWLPHGMILYRELERYWQNMHEEDYQETATPILNNADLYRTSGHWEHFRENMFTLKVDDRDFALKPMNCPSSTKIYAATKRSYRDLPLRFSEIGRLHRNEVSGTLGGLFRVRQITMDDAHIFCRPDQVEKEIHKVLRLVQEFYLLFQLTPTFKLATMPDEHLGEEATWRTAEASLENVLREVGLHYEVKAKDGAFYGPKIDIHIEDALGRDWQVATIQLDFQMPERFQLSYTDAKGKEQRPVMIHRAIFGSFERFIGILIEHYAGAFPLWLSPVQVLVINVGAKHEEPARAIVAELRRQHIRAEVDDANETVPNKIRKGVARKIPYLIVLGDREVATDMLAVRDRGAKTVRNLEEKVFLAEISEKIRAKA